MEMTKQIIFKDDIKIMTLEEIVNQFQALINKLVKSWIGKYDYEYEDLKQIGNLALVKAYNTYNSDKGISFLTYAQTVISREYLMNHRNNKSKDIFVASLNETTKLENGDKIELINLLKDDNTNVEELAFNNLQCDNIHKILSKFSNRERIVIELSFVENKRQTEIANILGITQTQVSRIIKKTLNKLRKELGD